MSDRSRWDPEMRAYQAEAETIAAKYPPVKLELPLEPHRAVNDAISLARAARGPEMAETTERWVAARGRRIASWPSLKTDVRNAGADWRDEPVVNDGNLVTSRNPDDIPQYNRGIIELYSKMRERVKQPAA